MAIEEQLKMDFMPKESTIEELWNDAKDASGLQFILGIVHRASGKFWVEEFDNQWLLNKRQFALNPNWFLTDVWKRF
jgi:hypothetical protein